MALHCKASRGANHALVEVHPDRYPIQAGLGSKGWVGLWLDLAEVDWDEVSALLRDAYRSVAPKGLATGRHEAKKARSRSRSRP